MTTDIILNAQPTVLTVPEVDPATIELTPAQQSAWLGLARGKMAMTQSLKAFELQAQSILLPVKESQDYKVIDEATATYRKAHTDMVEFRKPFTNAIDTGIVQPLMVFEKRVDPKINVDYITLTNRSLTLRQEETKKAAVVNQKNAEITRFKTFVENEFFRVAAEYRGLLRREITGQYEIALREKLNGSTTDIKLMMQTLAVPTIGKFATMNGADGNPLLTGAEMLPIYNKIPKPDFANIYMESCNDLDTIFANFDSDVANAELAIQHQKDQAKLAEIADANKLAEDTAITTLIATSELVVIDTPKIKSLVNVVVVESEQWAKAVMGAFIVNLPHMHKYIKVKSWAKLSIGQMAEYLGKLATETGTTFTNLQLLEVQK